MSAVNLIAVFAENQLGQLARITKVLADADANIRWMTVATSETFGVLKLLVDKPDLAFDRLHQAGWTVSRVEVLAVEVEERPGALHTVAECFSRNNVNVENSSGFVSHNRAVLLIEVQDVARARQILAKQNLRFLSQEEMLKL
jgi:hypothetical protein